MLLDNLIDHLNYLKTIYGGKIHIKIEFYDNEFVCHLDDAISIIKQDDRVTIRNF